MTESRRAAVVLAAVAVVVVILSAGLRPDAFYVGDPGVKLLAAHHAAANPTHPLRVPLPTIGTDRVPHVSPFFVVHDDHAHAVTSELFPLLTAPLLAALGLRGLYILPAIGFLAFVAACAWLGCALDPRRSPALLAATAAAGTPLLFYGLEFWEHAPAVAAATAATALLVEDRLRTGVRRWSGMLAGALLGLAILLRPEAAWFALAVVAASRLLAPPPRPASLGLAAVGAALVVAPFEIHTFLHFGSLVPGHLSANAGLLDQGWTATRLTLALQWFVPSSVLLTPRETTLDLWRVGPAALVALLSPVCSSRRDGRRFLWLAAGLDSLLVLLTAPNDGGGQWGPRYLLFAYVPLTVLAGDAVEAVSSGDRQACRRFPWCTRQRVRFGALACLLLLSLWVQRAGYRQLRGAKVTYGRIVDFAGRTTQTGSTVVTDIWWLDQIAAAPLRDRNVLFAATDEDARGILDRMGSSAVPSATVIRSGENGRPTEHWADGSCYAEEARDELPTRSLVAIRLRFGCGPQGQLP